MVKNKFYNEENAFTKEDLKYINEPFDEDDLKYIIQSKPKIEKNNKKTCKPRQKT